MFSQKSMTPIDRELSKKVVKIIHGLLMMEESAAFRKPVPHKALGLEDYKLIVKKPTDLNLIRRQNNEGKYKFVEEILDEIQLCWDNCKLYNSVESEIYEQALYLENAFDKFGQEVLPDFWKGLNRQDYNSRFNQRKIDDEKKKPDPKAKRDKPQQLQEYPSEELARSRPKKANTSSRQADPEVYPESEERKEGKMEEEGPEPVVYSQVQAEKESMEEEAEATVEPIVVNLGESPSREQLVELSAQVAELYESGEYALLEKVLEVLHSNEKEHMALNKNGLMTFKMSKIHISTYLRIKKLVGEEDMVALIE